MLTDQARAILAFEQGWEGVTGSRDAAIRNTFGVSPARYFQELYRVLNSAEALEAEPMLVKRLNRIRAVRATKRSSPFSASA